MALIAGESRRHDIETGHVMTEGWGREVGDAELTGCVTAVTNMQEIKVGSHRVNTTSTSQHMGHENKSVGYSYMHAFTATALIKRVKSSVFVADDQSSAKYLVSRRWPIVSVSIYLDR